MSFGPPVGFMGANSATAARDAGLPHAGVPGHLQEQVDAVLAREPDHPDPVVGLEYAPQRCDVRHVRFLCTGLQPKTIPVVGQPWPLFCHCGIAYA